MTRIVCTEKTEFGKEQYARARTMLQRAGIPLFQSDLYELAQYLADREYTFHSLDDLPGDIIACTSCFPCARCGKPAMDYLEYLGETKEVCPNCGRQYDIDNEQTGKVCLCCALVQWEIDAPDIRQELNDDVRSFL